MAGTSENKDGLTTFHELYSNYVLETYHEKIRGKLKYDIPREKFPSTIFQDRGIYGQAQIREGVEALRTEPSALKVCIIGAGAAGLYAAMILQSLGVEYEILEAQPSHIGGRLLTHHFSDSPNDYYVSSS